MISKSYQDFRVGMREKKSHETLSEDREWLQMWCGTAGRSTCWRWQLGMPVCRRFRVERAGQCQAEDRSHRLAVILATRWNTTVGSLVRWSAMDWSVRQHSQFEGNALWKLARQSKHYAVTSTDPSQCKRQDDPIRKQANVHIWSCANASVD